MTKWVIVMAMAARTVAPSAYRAAIPVENFPRLYLSLFFVCVNGGWTAIRIINDRTNTHISATMCRNTAEASITSSFNNGDVKAVGAVIVVVVVVVAFRNTPVCNTIGAGGGTRDVNMGMEMGGADTGTGAGADADVESKAGVKGVTGAASKLDAVSCNDVIHGRVATFALDAASRVDMARQCYCIE